MTMIFLEGDADIDHDGDYWYSHLHIAAHSWHQVGGVDDCDSMMIIIVFLRAVAMMMKMKRRPIELTL